MRRPVAALTAVLALVAAAVAAAAAPKPLPQTPNDPGFPGQWGLRLIGIPQVWQLAKPGVRPLVATIDTGVDATFPDLKDVVVPGFNLADNNTDTSDTAKHGTDVAIVLAANANNNYGIAGACPMCHLMPVKIADSRSVNASMLGVGIRWAVDHGARILIVSLGQAGDADPTVKPAVDYASSHGAVVIASAGNDAGVQKHYPAALNGVVSVAATDNNDQVYPWATHGDWVDLAAPGCEYGAEMCGASYAPPLVAGTIGLLLAAAPTLTPVQAVDALRATAVPVQGINGGRVDVVAAAKALGILPVKPTAKNVAPTPGQQLDLARGKFGRVLHKQVLSLGGPMTILLTRTKASSCTMELVSRQALYLAWRTTSTQLDLSATISAGTYTLNVSCLDTRMRQYSLAIQRLLPTSR
jgi:Subtilase family